MAEASFYQIFTEVPSSYMEDYLISFIESFFFPERAFYWLSE